eukprot:GHRR01004697.1.p1 GENE.GHRR01004697.1~~GHRR01004697.1.p1  ORF type:complete len:565 (+),score=206.90 GHRR01004697.1:238-1695(+)
MAENIANKDEAMRCLDIARSALRAGDVARAQKFSQKALRLYRCDQVQVFISELASQQTSSSGSTQQNGTCANGVHGDDRHDRDTRQQAHRQQQQQARSQHQQPEQQQQHQQHHQAQASQQSRHQQQPPQQPSGSNSEQHQQQHQRHHPPRGMGSGSEGLRHRSSQANHQQSRAAQPPPDDPSVTPEQRRLVQQILAAHSFYEVLGVAKSASDADIKQAYRKLALRLHPDKNKAHKADEAFKLLSRAFSCLSTPDKRAYYDRTGYESSSAAQAAAATNRRSHSGSMGSGSQFYYSGPDDFDPEEIFNMFFGAGAFSPHTARMFRSQVFGGGQPAYQRGGAAPRAPSREEQQRGALMGLMQLLPILLVIGITLFNSTSEPTYSLIRDGKFLYPMQTARLGVPFYVKDVRDFSANFAPNTHKRILLERQVESDVYERVYQRCQNERMAQHRAFTWGNRDTARRMELTSCSELAQMNEKMGAYNKGIRV